MLVSLTICPWQHEFGSWMDGAAAQMKQSQQNMQVHGRQTHSKMTGVYVLQHICSYLSHMSCVFGSRTVYEKSRQGTAVLICCGAILVMGDVKPAEITKCVRIEGGKSTEKGKWILDDVRMVDGLEMIPLVKHDAGFARFVTGSKGGLTKLAFLNELRQMRTKATIAACNDGLFAVPTSDRRAFVEQKRKWLRDGIPGIVEVELPTCEQYEARKIKVQGSLNFGAVVWVELNASVLDHIACCMRTSYKEEHGKKVVVGDGVRWSAERRCYIARRATKRMKTFRVDQDASDQELADNDAKVKARAWAQGNDLSSDDCDEDESGDDED